MKKILALLLAATLCLAGLTALAEEEEKVLNVFTWEGYFDETTLAQFTEETGIQVNYSTFASNEEMMLKLQANGGSEYDIVLASDYAISTIRKEGLIQPLDKSLLTNWDNLNPDYLNQYFDPDNVYSMPYTVGSPMIVYDPDQVDGELTSFSDLWREDLADSLWLIDDARVIVGETLRSLGYSYNTTEQSQLDEAAAKLAGLKPNIRVLDYDMTYNYLTAGEVKAAYLFTPFVVLSLQENPNLVAVFPSEGIGFGIDRMCMLLTDSAAIRDVLLFPTMKSLDADKKAAKEASAPAEAAQAAPEVEEKIDFSNVQIEPLFADLVDFETFSKSDFRAVKVIACEAVKKSKKLLKFTLDDGTGTERTILSGIHEYYEPEELVGKTCIAITNLPPRPMMGIDSCGMLISAVHHENGEEKLHLLMVDPHIPAGAKLY